MTVDVVNGQNEKVGSLDLRDDVFGGRIKTDLIHAEMLRRLGIDGKALLVDVKPEDKLALSVRNIEGVRVLPSNRISARDVADTRRVVLTRAALEKLQDALQ